MNVATPRAPIAFDVTGAELARLVEQAARRRGLTVDRFAIDISRWPGKWLSQLRAAHQPTPATIARVRALLAGERVPPPPPNNLQRAGTGKSRRPALGNAAPDPAAPPRARVERDPCFRCGVRGDVGCRHRAPAMRS